MVLHDGDGSFTVGWRRLGYRVAGPEGGTPVFLLHGTPGSRVGIRPSDADLAALDVRLITYDRPGYGRSHGYADRPVAQAAEDVRLIADHLGHDRFAVLGRSGGGPHALACAALLPHRVTRVASLVTLAPFDAEGLDWLDGMGPDNLRQYSAAMAGPSALARHLFPLVRELRDNPLAFYYRTFGHTPERTTIEDPAYRETWLTGIREALARSLEGWAADNLAFTRPWGFDPSTIRTPTMLWHGLRDVFSPAAHAHWLADRIADAVLYEIPDGTHLEAGVAQRDALSWLVGVGAVAV